MNGAASASAVDRTMQFIQMLMGQDEAESLREPLRPDEAVWFMRALDTEMLVVRPCVDSCPRRKKTGFVGSDEFVVGESGLRHLVSRSRTGELTLNREYIPHIAAWARAVADLGYDSAVTQFSRYRSYGRDLVTKRAGGSTRPMSSSGMPAGELALHVEAKAQAREVDRMAAALDDVDRLGDLPVKIVKEVEYVLDLKPQYLWIVGPGTVDPAAHVYRVTVDDLDATFERVDEIPRFVA